MLFKHVQSRRITQSVTAGLACCLLSHLSFAQLPFLPATQITDAELNESVNPNFFQVSNDGQRAIFLSTQGGTQEIFSVATSEGSVVRLNPDLVDGGDVTVVSAASRSVAPFQLTPNGLQVVYVADQVTDGVFELFLASVFGGPTLRLNGDLVPGGDVVAANADADFQISADGQWVVYVADQIEDSVFELFSVPLQGGTPIRLNADFASLGSDVVDFQISGDGQQVVYLADQDSNDTFELYSVPIAGGDAVRLNDNLVALGDVNEFQIDNSSSRVVYIADQNVFGDDELFSVPIAGGDTVRLNGEFGFSGGNSSDVVDFAVSPVAQADVVFLADSIVNDRFELFSVPITGGDAVRISGDFTADGDVFEGFEVSSDGLRVVYLANQNTDNEFELFSALTQGGTVTPLSAAGSPIATTQFLNLLPDQPFLVSGDAQQVVFLAAFSGTTGQLMSVPIAGGTPVNLDAAAPGNVAENYQISPASDQVLFTAGGGSGNLYTIPIAGGTAEPINGELPIAGAVNDFALSPTGQRIVYAANQTSSSRLDLFAFGDLPAPAAAVLPNSRSVLVGDTATAFATMINTSTETLQNCGVESPIDFTAAVFSYQTTNPSTNALIGTANTPAAIEPGAVQTFIFELTPTEAIEPSELAIRFDCTNSASALSVEGVNTLLLSGSTTPVADIIALGASPSGDGILRLPDTSGSAAFAVASVNIGNDANIVASVDTGSATVPLTLAICETNPADGQCLTPPAASVATSVNTNATPTFSVFVTASGAVPFDPANTRIRVLFLEDGAVRGSSSIAVLTP